jgi:5-methylcytosine-specific restriction endonuclease McrA
MHPDELIHLSDQCPKQSHKSRRRRLLSQNGGDCFFCGSPNAQTLDHLIAKAKGGTEHESNLLPCCSRDNANKGHEDVLSWFSQQRFYTKEKESQIKDRLSWAREWVV